MPLLEVKNLNVTFSNDFNETTILNDVSFSLEKGKILGIVGESGSGKSVTAYSIMQILEKNGKIRSGSIKFYNKELIGLSEKEMTSIRGNRISIIFQDPMTSLNPTYTIGYQLKEAIKKHTSLKGKEAYAKAIEFLQTVNINEPEKRMKQYPFELSGGMKQRVMIAMALVCEPDILIADEPTTALDVTVQAQILELICSLKEKLKMSVIIITHDLGVVAQVCDEVIVMYAGQVCEKGCVEDIFYNPGHKYTCSLLNSVPSDKHLGGKLQSISGASADFDNLSQGCAFFSRCSDAMKICMREKPAEFYMSPEHFARCWYCYKEMYAEKKNGENNERK